MNVPFVDLTPQHRPLARKFSEAFEAVASHGRFILGEEVAAFETAFARYLGVGHAIGVSSGIDALRLSLHVLGVEPGSEVVIPANTFVATALAVTALGARPVLVDVDERSFNIDVERLERAITPRTRAIVPVHLYGCPCDMDGVMAVAARHGLPVVEDACQAHGARYRNRACGTIAQAGCFSFYPAKNLGAFGDGGAIVTDDAGLATRMRRLRSYGERAKYEHTELGLNARLDTLQAAILSIKLPYLDEWNTERVRLAGRYDEGLRGVPGVVAPLLAVDGRQGFHLYVIRSTARDALRDALAAEGIGTGIHYPIPIHRQQCYPELAAFAPAVPVTERLAGEILSLPMYPGLGDDAVAHVSAAIAAFHRTR
ncbi:MAG: DegT/DnrJ/EryC1/StrS family aminotransferase [Candidatus Rokubacteria bacterium]|nr:DegT/DnrJ/EryC1/StrS family aminotransferase [Candidatus Rokubacteria bacterium]